jgi:hypothetical protein
LELVETLMNEALGHARQLFKGKLEVDLLESEEEWDATAKRKVLEASLMIKKELYEFEVITTSSGSICGFVDHSKWGIENHPVWAAQKLFELVKDSGWISHAYKPTGDSFRGRHGEVVLGLELTSDFSDTRFNAGFNTSSGEVIYLVPEDISPYA